MRGIHVCAYVFLASVASGQKFGQIEVLAEGGRFVFQNLEIKAIDPNSRYIAATLVNATDRQWRNPEFRFLIEGDSRPFKIWRHEGVLSIDESIEIFEIIPPPMTTQVNTITIGFANAAAARVPTESELDRQQKRENERLARRAHERAAVLGKAPKLDSGTAVVPVAADRKCLDQTVRAMGMEGLEGRKQLAELSTYGCIFTVPKLSPVLVSNTESAYALVTILSGVHAGRSGLVRPDWIKGRSGAGSVVDARKGKI